MERWWSHPGVVRVSPGVKAITRSIAACLVTVVLAACEASTPSPSTSAAPPTGPATTPAQSGPSSSAPAPSATASPSATEQPTGSRAAAPMIHPRGDGHATLLADGSVLVVGEDACLTAGANRGSEQTEVYDPTADRWTEVGSLNKPRSRLSLVARPDGTAIVLGGYNEEDQPFSSTKIYEPHDRAWSDGPLMERAGAVGAAILSDERIVAAQSGDTEVLDKGATHWRQSARPPHSVTVLGLVPLADDLVGSIGETFLIFDPDREQWHNIGSPGVLRPSGVGLDDGSILVFGDDEGGSHVRRYNAVKERWRDAAQLAHGRTHQQMALLPDGRVLVAGGVELISEAVDGGYSVTEGRPLASTEVYDPDTDTWTPGPPLLAPRSGGLAIPLLDGSVLILGGYGRSAGACPKPLATTERLVLER